MSQPMATADQWRRSLYNAASQIGAAPPLLLLASVMPLPVQGGKSLLGLPSLCVFRTLTGLPCPGCGITRSVVCCCHLRFADSIAFHPLGPIVFAWLLAAAVSHLPLPRSWRVCLPVFAPRVRVAGGFVLVILLIAVWGVRLGGWLPAPP
jgi:hypothetical protein